MKKSILTLLLSFISAFCFAQMEYEYDVLGDLKSKQWYCDQNFKSANLRSQKVMLMRACNDSISSYKTPVIWIEGNELLIQYPDANLVRYKYEYQQGNNVLVIYSDQNPYEPFKFGAVYILSREAFALVYTNER